MASKKSQKSEQAVGCNRQQQCSLSLGFYTAGASTLTLAKKKENMMRTTMMTLLVAAIIPTYAAIASEEAFLPWTSAVVQCGKTPQAGDISCEMKTGEKGWEKVVIQAFGKTHTLPATDLKKLTGFPLSSLRTTLDDGYEELGGYTVHFRFDRTLYNAEKKLVTEIVYVSVNKKGISVSDPRTKQQ